MGAAFILKHITLIWYLFKPTDIPLNYPPAFWSLEIGQGERKKEDRFVSGSGRQAMPLGTLLSSQIMYAYIN